MKRRGKGWQWKLLDGIITNLIVWSRTEDQAPFKDFYVSFLEGIYEVRDMKQLSST